MEHARILVVDDEPQMVGIVAFALEAEGFEVVTAFDGQQALDKVMLHQPDLVVLDVMLPKVDGFEVCRRVRESTTIPVLLLTAKKEDEDVIQGLELGADDYVTKPFKPRELVLRVRAILRRSGVGKAQTLIRVGDLQVDGLRHQATFGGAPLELTNHEFRLLACLAANAGRVLSWQALLKHAWDVESWEALGYKTVIVAVDSKSAAQQGENRLETDGRLTRFERVSTCASPCKGAIELRPYIRGRQRPFSTHERVGKGAGKWSRPRSIGCAKKSSPIQMRPATF